VAIPDKNRKFVGDELRGQRPLYIPLGFTGHNITIQGKIIGENNIILFLQILPDMIIIYDDMHFEVKNRTTKLDDKMPLHIREFTLELVRQFYVEDREYAQV